MKTPKRRKRYQTKLKKPGDVQTTGKLTYEIEEEICKLIRGQLTEKIADNFFETKEQAREIHIRTKWFCPSTNRRAPLSPDTFLPIAGI